MTHNATGGGYDGIAIDSVQVKAKDDDVLGVRVSAVTVDAVEGDAAGATYTLVLDAQPNVAIPVTVSPAAGSSVSVDPQIVTFTDSDWDTPQTIRVRALEDANAVSERVKISHGVSDTVADVTIEPVHVRVVDNDVLVTANPLTLSFTEGEDETATYTLHLESFPQGENMVAVRVRSGPKLTATPGRVQFTPSDWTSPRTVTVAQSSLHDADTADEEIEITHTVIGKTDEATEYVTARIVDDDENGVLTADGDLRLTDGDAEGHGRLEIFHDNRWGTICDDFFEMANAHVACRQLGYIDAAERIRAFGGAPSRSFWLDDVRCNGTESRLVDCHRPHLWGANNCHHREQVGVRCNVSSDAAGVQASPATLRITEDEGPGIYTVRLTTEPTGTVTVTAFHHERGRLAQPGLSQLHRLELGRSPEHRGLRNTRRRLRRKHRDSDPHRHRSGL